MKLKLPEHEGWAASALCAGEAPLYEAPEIIQGGMYGASLVVQYRTRAELCWDCPVMLQCDASASPRDRWWTIIAGEIPGVMQSSAERAAKKRVLIPGETSCSKGHPYATTPRTSDRRCSACKAEDRVNVMTQRREARLKARQESGIALSNEQLESGVCPNGHDIMNSSSINRLGRCKKCAAEESRILRNAAERARRKADREAMTEEEKLQLRESERLRSKRQRDAAKAAREQHVKDIMSEVADTMMG